MLAGCAPGSAPPGPSAATQTTTTAASVASPTSTPSSFRFAVASDVMRTTLVAGGRPGPSETLGRRGG